MKNVGKTTRPFSYDLNSISYAYTVEVTNRFKGLNLIDRVPDELWMQVSNHCTGGGDQNHHQEKEMQNGCLRRPYKLAEKRRETKGKGEKEDTHLNVEFQRIAKRDKKAFLSEQCKEIEENNRYGKD